MGTKTTREVEELARERGWAEVSHTGAGHLRLRHANEDVSLVFTSASPSDPRWKKNLEAQMAREERKAGLHDEPTPQPEETTMPKTDGPPYACQYCGKEYEKPQGRGIHEKVCEDNPDVWEYCQYCGKPCKGQQGLAAHEGRFCPENPALDYKAPATKDEEEELPPEVEIPPPEVKAKETLRTNGAGPSRDHEKVRGLLVDLLRDYDDLAERLYKGSPIDRLVELEGTLDATVDMIVESLS